MLRLRCHTNEVVSYPRYSEILLSTINSVNNRIS